MDKIDGFVAWANRHKVAAFLIFGVWDLSWLDENPILWAARNPFSAIWHFSTVVGWCVGLGFFLVLISGADPMGETRPEFFLSALFFLLFAAWLKKRLKKKAVGGFETNEPVSKPKAVSSPPPKKGAVLNSGGLGPTKIRGKKEAPKDEEVFLKKPTFGHWLEKQGDPRELF